MEKEYIRNLQQQIYFLELECDYLRDQANQIVEVPNNLTMEAGRLVKKLKVRWIYIYIHISGQAQLVIVEGVEPETLRFRVYVISHYTILTQLIDYMVTRVLNVPRDKIIIDNVCW